MYTNIVLPVFLQENIINIVFYVVVFTIVVASLGFDPLAIFLSISGVVLGKSSLPACHQYEVRACSHSNSTVLSYKSVCVYDFKCKLKVF
jgi:hypothetical protein